jgi:hypothetical protein
MTIPPDQQALVDRALRFEQLVISEGWIEAVRMWNQQRDRWLARTQMEKDRDYLSGQATAVNLLTNSVYNVIEQKDALLAALQQQELEALERAKTSSDELPTLRPPPQAV